MTESPWSVIQNVAEQRILEAQARGEFENLPGQGKPLLFEDDSTVPEELRMAYKVLKNAGCLPPELAERKEINSLVELLDNCKDEQARVHHMQKLKVMIMRAKLRYQRPLHLEEADDYYDRILQRLGSGKQVLP